MKENVEPLVQISTPSNTVEKRLRMRVYKNIWRQIKKFRKKKNMAFNLSSL